MTGSIAWLASYPKSGNTWVRALLAALAADGDPDLNEMASIVPGSERLLAMSPSAFSLAEWLPVVRRAWWAEAPDQGYLHRKTHAPWLPGDDGFPVLEQPPGATAIYLIRDPRDIVASWAHHLGVDLERAADFMRDGMPFEEFALDPINVLPGWSDHVESWLDQRDVPTLVLRYEDLWADPAASLEAIVTWLGRPATAEQIRAAVSACTFENLAAQELTTGFLEAASRERPFFRRGVVGSWRTDLPGDLVARIEAEHGVVMRRCGYLPASVESSI